MSIANLSNTDQNPSTRRINTSTTGPFSINTYYEVKKYGSIIFISFRNIVNNITTVGQTTLTLTERLPIDCRPLVGHNQVILCLNNDISSTCLMRITSDGEINFFISTNWVGASQNGPINSTVVYDCRI